MDDHLNFPRDTSSLLTVFSMNIDIEDDELEKHFTKSCTKLKYSCSHRSN